MGWIVALEGEPYLHDAPSEQNKTDRANDSEDKITEIVYHSNRIPGGKDRYAGTEHQCNGK
jgi:hypothetical protein